LLANPPSPPSSPNAGPAVAREVVCSCNDVDAASIAAALAEGPALAPGAVAHERASLEWLQGRLRCGTTCGSCLPAVKALVRQHRAAMPPEPPELPAPPTPSPSTALNTPPTGKVMA
jgi:assimilatory nitrate reductase catalytic subunit